MPQELTPIAGKEGNLAQYAISGVGNDITWGDLYNAESHICYINDGDPNTALISKPGESLPHYIYLDWMEPQVFDSVVLTTRAGLKQGPTAWDIDVSEDGLADWHKVAASGHVDWRNDKEDLEMCEVTFDQVEQVRALRLVIREFNGNKEEGTYQIQDLAVFLNSKS
nr:discoidin domain-containing protein [Paenibacillus segetis]